MARRRKNGVPWSDLPVELLQKISRSLDTETDVLRFRAVCNSWRSSTTPFKKYPFPSLKLPFPFSAAAVPVGVHPIHDGAYFSLTERTVYRVQSPKRNNPNSWLVKIENAGDGKLRLVSPLNDRQIKILPETPIPKVLNTLNFRVSEVCRAYTLHYVNPTNPKQNDEYRYAKKVVVSANSESNDYVVMAIDDKWTIVIDVWYIKSGEDKWTIVPTSNSWHNTFLDVAYYKGQFYGVDVNGSDWVFDSNLDRTKITCYLCSDASKRHLVELYDGELYLVEGVTDKDKRTCKCTDIDDGCQCRFPNTPVFNTVVEIVISRMDRPKYEWVETKTVNDRVIFVGDDCSFALPSKEFKDCNGTRVFYTDAYISFRTEEEKVDYHDDYGIGYEGDGDYGYDDYHECDCCGCSSDDEDVVRHDDFVPRAGVKLKFRGLHGHNVGVCDFESGKIGSLLKFPEFAGVFWPPPRWLK
ncbi:putative F-box protein at5g60060 [Phtheirospermum japonicum]|uniref:Putative F-box protein at5g60060 n=1 Tax=Phtheirospermum japonicum TaxID=374723 RepID=A0A830BLY1_9LAMI|nr:putative F-box protein at5g60060 [Phtheirospermum japonicum]